jgi:toxin ParE1/3/4
VADNKARYRLSREAEADIESILSHTLETFGTDQFKIYRNLLRKVLEALAEDPNRPSSKARRELGTGVRTLHAAVISRRSTSARHIIVYAIGADNIVHVLRILHESMDLSRHLPPEGDDSV